MPAFPPSLRQTIVVIDGRELSHADSAEEIRTRNASVIDAVATIAGKALAPRERLKIVLAPTDGLQPKLLFTGCLPGYSPDELRAAQAKSSAADAAAAEFFGQGASQKAAAALEAFESMAVGALVQAAKAVPEGLKSDAGVPFASSSIVASLHNANSLINLEDGAPRIFVLSDLARFDIGSPSNVAEARKAGFATAAAAGVDLSRAELHVMLAQSGSSFARDFSNAFFLRSEALLLSWGNQLPSSLPNAPARLLTYSGTVDYAPESYPMQARLAVDRNGVLVNSWVLLKYQTERAVPLSGVLSCSEAQACSFSQDAGAFAQVWSPTFQTGAKPVLDADLPFAGMRGVEFSIVNGKIKGKVSDPAVSQIGDDPHKSSLSFVMSSCDGCRL